MKGDIRSVFSDPKKRLKLIFIIGAAGIALILLSELIQPKQGSDGMSEEMSTVSGELPQLEESEYYRSELEKRLTDIVSQIDGAGEVKVMLLVSSTKEYIYAEQSELSRQTDQSGETVRSGGEIVLAGGTGERSPVIKKVAVPEISGAAVICSGADDPTTKERVMNTVSALLGLPSYRISVEQMK